MANADVLAPIQRAMYDRMAADSTLTGKASLHDDVPDGAGYPRVVLGEATSTAMGALDRFGARSTETLHIWSTHNGYSEALGIVGDLMRLFDHQPLTLSGHFMVVVRHEQTVTMRDPDSDLRHVVVRFSIETEHPA